MDKRLMVIMVLLLIGNLSTIKTATAQTTMLYIDPQSTTIENIGETFEINVSISRVTNLTAWEFKLYYESSVLNATSITEGPFLKSVRATQLIPFNFTDYYNATHGRIWYACVLIGPGPGADGNGTLATITFKAKGSGTANLHLSDTDLLDSKMPPDHISHATRDGEVTVAPRNIAIIDVKSSKTIIGLGLNLSINVTAANQGLLTETINVTVYANTTILETRNITLPGLTQATIPFSWNTSTFAKGNYTISAYARPVPGETDLSDNERIDGSVILTIPGDVDGSFSVDGGDLGLLGLAWFSKPGDPNWNPGADIDGSELVNGGDLGILGLNWFKVDP